MVNDLIWDELKSRVFNGPSDPPKMNVEEIDELEEFGNHLVPGEGFTFYLEEE
jgi:hypothetical protein